MNRMFSLHTASRSVKLQPADAMKAALLFTLLSVWGASVHSRVSVTVSPGFSQFFEYGKVSLGCDHPSSDKWAVWRYSKEPLKLSKCGDGWGEPTRTACIMETAKVSDSGVYWCQSIYRDSSNTVNITVTDQKVILQSPVLPVMEGADVRLSCRTNYSDDLPADFYKDDSHIGKGRYGYMYISRFKKSHEGVYSCEINSYGKSPRSWLLMKDDSKPPLLTVSPDSSQMLEYKDLSLSCGDNSRSQGWRIVRSTTSDPKISSCGEGWGDPTPSGCGLEKAKQPDSATYWCESPTKQRSNSLDIVVPETEVILQIPVLPVTEGDNVTLICRAAKSTNPSADFHKDGDPIGTEPTGHMTIYNVSMSDEGLYKCNMSGFGASRYGQLLVRDPSDAASPPEEPTQLMWEVMRHLVVSIPYLFSTVLMVCEYRRRPTGRNQAVSMTTSPPSEDDGGQYDDIVAGVTTEHNF